jgi:hypothetical protein
LRKKPTYDWEWFENHTPFKSTLEKMCDLQIEHEIHRIPVWLGCYTINHHYKIKYNHLTFERDFTAIKAALLKTNICKSNADVYEFVNKRECSKRTFSDLVLDGCICRKNKSCSFEWDDGSDSL